MLGILYLHLLQSHRKENLMDTLQVQQNTFATDLKGFTGTTQYYRYHTFLAHYGLNFRDAKPTHTVVYTDGCKFFWDKCGGGAYWLLDKICYEVCPLMIKHQEDFLVLMLTVKDSKAKLKVTNGNHKVLYRNTVEYTDAFPGEYKFYIQPTHIQGQRVPCILLPTEY